VSSLANQTRTLTNGAGLHPGQPIAHRANQQSITSAFGAKQYLARTPSETKNDKNSNSIAKPSTNPSKLVLRVSHSGLAALYFSRIGRLFSDFAFSSLPLRPII